MWCFLICLMSTGQVTTVQRRLLSPGQRDEDPGHHAGQQNVKLKVTKVCHYFICVISLLLLNCNVNK